MTKIANTPTSIINRTTHGSKDVWLSESHLGIWKRVRINALLLLVTMIWGGTFLVTQYMINVVGLFTYLGYNFGLGTITLVLISHKRLFCITRSELVNGLVLGILIFVGYSSQTIGLQYTTTSKAGFLTGLYVPLVPVFAVFLFRQKIKLGAVLGFGLSLLGLVFLSINKDFDLVFGLGEVLVMGCALAFALHIVVLGKFAPRADTMNLTIIQLATTSILCFCAATLFHQSLLLPATFSIWGVILFMGVINLALCMAIMSWAQKFISSTHAALIYACEPVWAGIFGVLVGQVLSPLAWIGGACICVGMILSEMRLASLKRGFRYRSESLDNSSTRRVTN